MVDSIRVSGPINAAGLEMSLETGKLAPQADGAVLVRVGDTVISVPCMGIFELRDGKIAAWRDYWDLQQFERQIPAVAQPT
mgnify:CR=1 FL=1